jgi:hypothetical protein
MLFNAHQKGDLFHAHSFLSKGKHCFAVYFYVVLFVNSISKAPKTISYNYKDTVGQWNGQYSRTYSDCDKKNLYEILRKGMRKDGRNGPNFSYLACNWKSRILYHFNLSAINITDKESLFEVVRCEP